MPVLSRWSTREMEPQNEFCFVPGVTDPAPVFQFFDFRAPAKYLPVTSSKVMSGSNRRISICNNMGLRFQDTLNYQGRNFSYQLRCGNEHSARHRPLPIASP